MKKVVAHICSIVKNVSLYIITVQVSESLKMLALGDRAWNSNIGSRSKKVRKPTARSTSPAKDKNAAKDKTSDASASSSMSTAAQVDGAVTVSAEMAGVK